MTKIQVTIWNQPKVTHLFSERKKATTFIRKQLKRSMKDGDHIGYRRECDKPKTETAFILQAKGGIADEWALIVDNRK